MKRPAALAIAAWLLCLALCGWVIARTPFITDLSAFLPARPDARQQLLIDQLQGGVAARMLMAGIDGGEAGERAAASRRLAASLRDSGLFTQVQNGDTGEDWQRTGEWLFAHRYQLSPNVAEARFDAAGLRDAIDETLSQLGTPAGNAMKPLLERDPTGETRTIAESLVPLSAPRSDGGVWVSRTLPRALLLAVAAAPGADLDAQAVAVARIRSAFAADAQAKAAGLSLQLSGAPLFAVESRSAIESEAKHLALGGCIAIGTLLLLAFASVRALAVGALPVLTGVAVGVAAVSLVYGGVHGLTLGFGGTLIGETVDYAIYYLIQARTAGVPGSGWRHWLHTNWRTVRLGLLTSVCGFAALVFSGFPGLSQLGVFSIAGLVGAALTTRFVLPVLVPDGAPGRGLRRHMARLAGAVVHGMPRWRVPLLLLALASAAWLALRPQPLWSGDLQSLSPVPKAAQEMDAALRADLGASDSRVLVVARGADAQAALRAAEAAGARLDTLVNDGVLAGYDSPARLMPSEEAQRRRLAALPDAPTLRTRLAEATAGGPLQAARLEPFVAEVQAARAMQPLLPADLQSTPLAPLLDALLTRRPDGGWSALLALQPGPDGVDAERVRRALDGTAADAQVLDIANELHRLYAGYLHEAFVQAGLGALAVTALLAWHLRSARRLFAVCLPLVLAVLLTMGGLAALGVQFGILHLVGLLLVVAVGSNYALFFDQIQRDGQLDDDTLASLLLANVATVITFALIAVSALPSLSAIGRVVAPGALLALLLSAACAPRRP